MISAFVIYVHQVLQTNQDGEIAALLRAILDEMGNTGFRKETPQVPNRFGFQPTVVASLVLLYLSLVAEMAAALFSISAKRFLNLHAFADRMQPEERAREIFWTKIWNIGRGGHRRITRLPLRLLLLAFFTFSCGLVVYLWKVYLTLALLVLMLIVCVVLMLVSLCLYITT